MHDFTTINIREYLNNPNDDEIGENALIQILSDYSCELNLDVERFLKEQSIEFSKKHQSVTYLVLSNEDAELLGYFTLTVKPITIKCDNIKSKTILKKIARVSDCREDDDTYSLSAYLIAQLGKNYANHNDKRITGKQLLGLAINQIKDLQYLIGGTIMFLEAEKKPELIKFYKDNGFVEFDTRETTSTISEQHTLIQLLKVIK